MICSLQNVFLHLNNRNILEDISLNLKKGEITTLIGPNGGGKTSIARIATGILKPSRGKVVRNKKTKIGYMPQSINLDKTIPLSVEDFIKLDTKKITIDLDLAEKLQIRNIFGDQIHELSGGQLQKVLFLKAISKNPSLLVLDEPTQYMDIKAIEEFYKIIEEIRNKKDCAILLISHDLLTIMQKTNFVFCINKHICCSGTPENVNEHPEYLSLFGQKSTVGIYQHHHNHQH